MATRHQPSLSPTVTLSILVSAFVASSMAASRPHIVVIIADDLGWGDVGWRDSEMATPVLDRMASEGVNLNSAYVQPLCSPSRAAFLSGKYPFKMGMQDSVLATGTNDSLPLELEILPERLKTLGYSTHLVGKWHLGFCSWDMTPTYRGFDSFYGMYSGKSGFYDHKVGKGYDLHFNDQVQWSDAGVYSTHLFTDRAIEVIEAHDAVNDPLFLMVSYQAVHSPLEVPAYYVDTYCNDVTDPDRQTHCAMTAAMDEGIGNITDALTSQGYDDNLLVFFTSDNGGPITIMSSNWPLRGGKSTLWEGGTRAVSFLHSKALLPDAPYTWDGLAHITDWYPTFLSVAGDSSGVTDIDGLDLWSRIKNNARSTRTEVVYNINEVQDNAAIRQGKFKLVYNKPGNPDGWYNPPTGVEAPDEPSNRYPEYQLFDVVSDPEETTDISDKNQVTRQAVSDMQARLTELRKDLVPVTTAPILDASDPSNFGGAWYPGWC